MFTCGGKKAKWYLERNDEMREIQYERGTYFKYWEFEEKKEEILRNLGEEIKLVTQLDGSTSISFSNPNFVSKEVIFPEFREQLNQVEFIGPFRTNDLTPELVASLTRV